MPDTVAPDQQVQQDQQFTQSQQDTNRQQLYERYYGSQDTTSSGDAPVDDTSSSVTTDTSTAQVEVPVTSTDTTAPQQLSPEVITLLQSMQEQLQATRAELATLRAPAPVTPPVTPAAPAEARWVTLLKEGKVAEAEDALAESVATKVQQKVQQPVVEQTLARSRAEAEIETFVIGLRRDNPDLVPMERYITVEASATLAQLQAQGKIQSPEDAVREYKKAVLDATESARKLAQTLRGAGKTEAQIRNREVVSSTPVTPQPVVTPGQRADGSQQQQQPESSEDYFAKRRAQTYAGRGLSA